MSPPTSGCTTLADHPRPSSPILECFIFTSSLLTGQLDQVCFELVDWEKLALTKLKLVPGLIIGFSSLVSQKRWFGGGLWWTEGYLQCSAGG